MDGAPSGSGCGSLPDPTPEKTITKSTSSELGGASPYRVSFAQMYRYGFDEVNELEGIMQPPMFLDNLDKNNCFVPCQAFDDRWWFRRFGGAV